MNHASMVVLIPALNEARTVAAVARTALSAKLGPVCVIDDGSSDGTAAEAAAAGADVLRLARNHGKAGAVLAAASQRSETWVMLLDADLLGLHADHVHALAAPVLAGDATMTRGIFTGGRWRTTWAQRLLPVLNGQRVLPRAALTEINGLAQRGYGLEVAIERYARSQGWRSRDVSLSHVTQRMKEEKHGLWVGTQLRLRMYAQVWGALFDAPRSQPREQPHGHGIKR